MKTFRYFIFFVLFFTANVFAFADDPSLTLDSKSLFKKGVVCYKHKQYGQAKLYFSQLEQRHDRRGESWLRKTDLVISRRLTEEMDRQKNLYEVQQQAQRAKAEAGKSAQEDILRQEAQHQQALEDQERRQEAQLNVRRQALRTQIEEGVEAMYQQALSLYKQGDYAAAAGGFKDLLDLFPGYKDSEQYLREALQKSSKPQDNVSRALDLFSPDAK